MPAMPVVHPMTAHEYLARPYGDALTSPLLPGFSVRVDDPFG